MGTNDSFMEDGRMQLLAQDAMLRWNCADTYEPRHEGSEGRWGKAPYILDLSDK